MSDTENIQLCIRYMKIRADKGSDPDVANTIAQDARTELEALKAELAEWKARAEKAEARAVKCDRCGFYYDSQSYPTILNFGSIAHQIILLWGEDQEVNLCGSCANQFVVWFETPNK
jgi:hypothetical protein